jgi:hypothetical protein
LGNGIKSIGAGAFQDCSSLASITIPVNLTTMGSGVFYGCTSLTSVTLPNGLTTIGEGMFDICISLTTLTIPDSVISVGDSAFWECDSLTNCTIGRSVAHLGASAFSGCCSRLDAINVSSLNLVYSSTDGVLFDKRQTTLIQYPQGRAGDYTVPNTVAEIGPGAFASCASLTGVSIPNSVTRIDVGAFQNCSVLTSVTIPNSLTNIGDLAFAYCANLTAIKVDALNRSYSSVDGVLLTKNGTALIECPSQKAGSYTIPASVTSIGGEPFPGCTKLTSITIPASVTNIEASAFSECSSLTNAFFLGNAPFAEAVNYLGVHTVFSSSPATVYYLPGTLGWGTNFGGAPTALWALPYPLILNNSVGVRTTQFGFIVSWATNLSIVVEASTDLVNPKWSPVATNVLSWGTNYFTDPQWANYPSRFYRVRSQ